MRRFEGLWWGLAFLAACGGDDDSVVDLDAGLDAGAVDAARIDAGGDIDARGPDLSCLGDPAPGGELPASLLLNGDVQEVFLTTAPMIRVSPEVAVEARDRTSDALLASTSSGSLGEYAVELATGGRPVDAYLALSKPGFINTYLFSPDPLGESTRVPLTVLVPTALLDLAPQLGILPGHGIAAVRVVDCAGEAIADLEPTIVAGGGGESRLIDARKFLPGTYLAINIPIDRVGDVPQPTPVTLGATYDGVPLQANPIKVFFDAVSFTEVHP